MKRLLTLAIALAALVLFPLASSVHAQGSAFTIRATVENPRQGSISPSGNVSVGAGGSQTFVISPNEGYKIAYVQVNGRGQGVLNSYTFTNVSGNHTIAAGFTEMTYTINASSGPNGAMTPNSLVVLMHGQDQTFTITPNPGYKVQDVIVDGTSRGPLPGFTFTGVTGDHTISVSFAAADSSGQIAGVDGDRVGAGVTDLTGFVSPGAVFVRSITAISADGRVSLAITAGTSARTIAGLPLGGISILPTRDYPAPDPGTLFVSPVYDILPEGVSLGLEAGLSIRYDPSQLPQGVSEDGLRVLALDNNSGRWAPLQGATVDQSVNSITAPLDRFSKAVVAASLAAPEFSITDLSISPRETGKGNPSNVSVAVTNTGDVAGAFKVTLSIDNVVEGVRDVTLTGGATERVVFAVSRQTPGAYAVSVHGLTGTLTVTDSAPPVAAPVAPSPTNWALLMGIIGGAVAAVAMISMLVFMALRRRRSA